MNILYEDKYIVCPVKEPGIPSQKDPSGRRDMTELLCEKCGIREVFCVHRLDTATGGVMVYAKDKNSAAALSRQFAAPPDDKAVEKEYLCAVRAENIGSGKMEDLLYHDRIRNKTFTVDKKRAGVKRAALIYECLREHDGISIVKVRLLTGRTHQIRAQFASRGMPLCGDGKYGSRDKCSLALMCTSLSFCHPHTGERIIVSVLPPDAFPWK